MPTPTPTPTPTATPSILPDTPGVRDFQDYDVPFLRWEVGPHVPDSMYYDMRNGVILLRQYITSLGLSKIEGQASFYLYWDIIPALARVKGISEEDARRGFEEIGHPGSEERTGDRSMAILKSASVLDGSSPLGLAHGGAHSLAHSYQLLLLTLRETTTSHSEVDAFGPAWLNEGGAEFQTIRAFAKGGLYRYDRRRDLYREAASTVYAPLPELETFGGFLPLRHGYELSTMAVELLAAHAGEEAVITYWTLLRPGTTWEEAFSTSFGITVEEFYPIFEAHRAAGFPELDLPSIEPSVDKLPQVDRPALIAFYNATGGANWEKNTNWLSDAHIGRWHGVTINPSGRVIGIDLARNGLRGELPPELGSLTELKILSVWANQLRGTVPPELAALTKLEHFSVGGNQLSGDIPSWLGNLSNLRVLQLVSNQFTGSIPSWIGDLPLRGLYLAHNRLSGDVPAELGNLSGLRTLYLDGNNLTGCIPDELRNAPENDFVDADLPFCGQ